MEASDPEIVTLPRRLSGRFVFLCCSGLLVVGAVVGISTLVVVHDTSSVQDGHIRTAADRAAAPDPSDVDDCIAQQISAEKANGESLTPDGVMKVLDRTLGPTTIGVRQYCVESLALAAPVGSGIEASYYVESGHVVAQYSQVTTVTTPDGVLRHTTAPQPLTDEQARQALAAAATAR
jgi:hypothetical protein